MSKITIEQKLKLLQQGHWLSDQLQAWCDTAVPLIHHQSPFPQGFHSQLEAFERSLAEEVLTPMRLPPEDFDPCENWDVTKYKAARQAEKGRA